MYKTTLSALQNKELLIEYKKNKNSLNSQLKNTDILYYSNELDINKHDASKSWKTIKKYHWKTRWELFAEKDLEMSLLPYITANIPNTPMQHGYKTQHSTVTALHTLNNTVAKGFNQMAPPARTITVALDMSKAFDTINIHTLIRKLLQTNIPDTIIKFIANYIKGRKAYITYRNHAFQTTSI